MAVVRIVLLFAAALVTGLLLVLALIGVPAAFRIVAFAASAAAVLIVANIGDILASFGAARTQASRAIARLSGRPVPAESADEERGRRALTDLICGLALLEAGLGLLLILEGVPPIPAGAPLGLLVLVPAAAVAVFAFQVRRATRLMDRIAERARAAERMHAAVHALADRLSAQIAAEAESRLALVAGVLAYAARAVAQDPEVVSLRISFRVTVGTTDQTNAEDTEDIHLGTRGWIENITAILDSQPIGRAQAWIDRIAAVAGDFSRAAVSGGDLHIELPVDPQ
jgi:hypothetical protein